MSKHYHTNVLPIPENVLALSTCTADNVTSPMLFVHTVIYNGHITKCQSIINTILIDVLISISSIFPGCES